MSLTLIQLLKNLFTQSFRGYSDAGFKHKKCSFPSLKIVTSRITAPKYFNLKG